jgi:hypothetical protein
MYRLNIFFSEGFMKNYKIILVFLVTLLLMVGCSNLEGGSVIITNNSNREYTGRIWTDSQELFNGTIRSWRTRTFFVSENINVYTDFESSNGNRSSPSGYVSRGVSLILDLN